MCQRQKVIILWGWSFAVPTEKRLLIFLILETVKKTEPDFIFFHDRFFSPEKVTKIGVGEKPFFTSDLKALKRRRVREYRKNGKYMKYLRLVEEFQTKFRKLLEITLEKMLIT